MYVRATGMSPQDLSRKPNLTGTSISTCDLLVLTSLDHLLFTLQLLFTLFQKTSYLNVEVNCTEPSPSVRVPWINVNLRHKSHDFKF
jgi:hypothetical protein